MAYLMKHGFMMVTVNTLISVGFRRNLVGPRIDHHDRNAGNYDYDLADQITDALLSSATETLKRHHYDYDYAGNRSGVQKDNAVASSTCG